MKRIIIFCTLFQLILISVHGQKSDDRIDRLTELNKQVVEKFKSGNYKEAQEDGIEVLNLSLELFGDKSNETANCYYNLGEIFAKRKKYKEASINFRKSLEIYQQNPIQNELKATQVMDSLGVVLALEGKTEEAEEIIKDLIIASEIAFGAESKSIIPALNTAKSFYVYSKKYDQAEMVFVRIFKTALKVYGEGSDQVVNAYDDFHCYAMRFSPQIEREKEDKFHKLIAFERKSAAESEGKTINSGVINGKAISLPVPDYPLSAKMRGSGGKYTVKVLIEESGNVISAKAMCAGDRDLKTASEDAAMKAKFRPTMLEGVLVKVSGVITYIYNR